MAVPQQVKQRAQQIEEFYAKRAEEEAQAAANAAQQEPGDAEGDAEQTEEAVQDEAAVESQPESTAEPTAEPPRDDVQRRLDELQEKLAEYDQRYKTLQGMVRHKEDENQRLQALLSQMAEGAESKAEPQQKSAPPEEAKDRDDFGDDFVDMVVRVVDRKMAALNQRLAQIEGMTRESHASTVTTRKEKFEAKLTERVPNWRDIDTTQEFTQWLNSSPTRVQITKEGLAQYDADAVAEVFEMYLKLHGDGQTEQESKPKPKSLEGKVAPSKGRASKPSSSAEKKLWTRSEIAQVFNNRRSYSQKEFDSLQRDIFAAQKEGRVDYAR